jgi:hypothetical protein
MRAKRYSVEQIVAKLREADMIYRVDPDDGNVVATIPLGASPTALAAADNGIWVAVG